MVGERGFEPPTPWSRTRCSTRLSHSPTCWKDTDSGTSENSRMPTAKRRANTANEFLRIPARQNYNIHPHGVTPAELASGHPRMATNLKRFQRCGSPIQTAYICATSPGICTSNWVR
jgi:hypothetical protein